MKAYSYNAAGQYIGEVACQIDPVQSKKTGQEVYLLPANATYIEPPGYDSGTHIPVWNGDLWELNEIDVPEQTTPTHEEINEMVVAKIREQYDVNEEFKMINLGIADPGNEQYQAYRAYVAECIAFGDTLETE